MGKTLEPNNKHFVLEDGKWLHRPPLKVFINNILRKIQFFTDRPFIIYSKTITITNSSGIADLYCMGYWIGRIKHIYTATIDEKDLGGRNDRTI